jgi:hypothetical protein
MQSSWAPLNRLRRLLAFFIVLPVAASHTAKAQVSVYGTVAATNYGYALNSNDNLTTSTHLGFGGGLTYNFPIESRLTAGIDLRGSVTPAATGGGLGAASLRFGFVPYHNPFKPYVQVGGGFVTAKVPAFSSTVGKRTITSASLDLAFGLDLRITPHFDLRLLELQGSAGGASTRAGSGSFSTGIVYHFHRANPKNL